MKIVTWFITVITISFIASIVECNKDFDHLPKSIFELKKFYDVIKNLEQRGIINKDVAHNEKELYIEMASRILEKKELLTEEEFVTWKQREIILSFSNIVAVIAGITVVIAVATVVSIFILPILIATVPNVVWEILFYTISAHLMIFVHNQWLVFLGCLSLIPTISLTIKLHFRATAYSGLVASWSCFLVWTFIAISQQHREAGYLAVMALESSLGFVVFVGELFMIIGFYDDKAVSSATLASFLLILIGSFLHIREKSNILTIPFTRPSLFLGTFVYFIGILILSSRLYSRRRLDDVGFWLLQIIGFISGLAAMFFGPMLELPFVQAVGGTMFVIWLLEKYAEIAPRKSTMRKLFSLLGFGLLLYVLAYVLKMHPEYFIFHTYNP